MRRRQAPRQPGRAPAPALQMAVALAPALATALALIAARTAAADPAAVTAPGPAAAPPAAAPPAAPSPPAPPAPPVTGMIRGYADHVLTLGSAEFGELRARLGPATRVVINRPGTLADIAAGAFIGTTAVQGADGRLRATEVHVFPEALRGTGEGHYPWGNQPATTMTNGSVRSMTNGSVTRAAGAAAGLTLDVGYAGGQTQVEVGAEVPVVVITLADEGALQPGARVLVLGQPDATGTLAAGMVAVLPPAAAQPPAPAATASAPPR
ncbi:MAG: hypothetical protein U1F06_01985 [Steroidobacteraceae bacterium]